MNEVKDIWIRLGLLIVSYIILSANIGGIDIYGFDEARNAYCAREMQLKLEWIIPTFNGELRTYKPPLHYYFMIFGYKIFGYGSLGARIFSSLVGVLTILTVFEFSKKYLNRNLALIISGVLLASIHFSIQIHQSVPDPYLIFFISLGSLLLFSGSENKKLSTVIIGYLVLGMAILSKGPVAIVLPGFGIFLYLLFFKGFTWKTIISYRPFLGVFLAIAVAFPWYYLVNAGTGGEFTKGFFLEHNLGRFSRPMEGHGGIFLLTWLYVLIGMLPFSVFLPGAIVKIWKTRKTTEPYILYSLSLCVSVIVFFSISSTKLINYTTPAYPFVAIICGYYVYRLVKESRIRTLNVHLGIIAFISTLLFIGAMMGIKYEESIAHLQRESFFLILLPFGSLLAIYFLNKREFLKSFMSVVISFSLAGCVFFWWFAPKMDEVNPYRVIAPYIETGTPIIGFRNYNPAFISLMDSNIESFTDIKDLEQHFKEEPKTSYVLTQKRFINELHKLDYKIIAEQKDLFEKQTSILVKIINE